MKRAFTATLILFVVWTLLEYIVHGVILMDAYAATASLWRPEMDYGLMNIVRLISAFFFVLLYGNFVTEKSGSSGLRFGLLLGLLVGVGMGYGSYSYMPIGIGIAHIWFASTVVVYAIGGVVVGWIMGCTKESCCCQATEEA